MLLSYHDIANKEEYIMNWTLPGTTITARREDADQTRKQFDALFLAGGLALSQVAAITGLEPYTIQNWVKRGFLPPPKNKRYDMEQLCRILNINILKGPLPIEQITKLMAYLNGSLSDERDDLVDDTMLYFMFVRLAARARYIGGTKAWDDALVEITETYQEPIPGAKQKLIQVLKIMLTAWCANRLQQQAMYMIQELDTKET
jgi:DNA-binding transcriptional MerR regulator